jgi:hypothetical protein
VGPLEAARCHAAWEHVVADDALFESIRAGGLDECTTRLDPGERVVLDALALQSAALVWNVTNLRFRASLDTMLKLRRWMPLTTALLSGDGSEGLRQLCDRYLDLHHWKDLGHRHFAECLRFAGFVSEQVEERPDHFTTVFTYETALCALLAESATVPDGAWGPEPDRQAAPAALFPRPGPLTRLVELDEDISSWIATGRPTEQPVDAGPTTLLLFVPRHGDTYWVTPLDPDQEAVFRRCTGLRPAGAVAEHVAGERGLNAADVLALVVAWAREGALMMSPER